MTGHQTGQLADYGIVYFGNDWFAENRTSSHHVARRLARTMPVLYVDSPGLRPPGASGRDLRRLWRKVSAARRPPQALGDQFWHCTVPQIPYRALPGVDAFNRAFGLHAVRSAIRRVGFQRWISWFVVPHPGFMAGRLAEDFCVYYCIDDYAAFPGVDRVRMAHADRALTEAADLVFVAPPALVEAKRTLNPHTCFAPHGVDVELFRAAMDPATPIPEIARRLGKPVIGYFGSIAGWIDLELLERIALERPTWTLLLVGQTFVDVSRLRALPNVVFAGPQPYESLPGWARAFDVAIIPYRMGDQVTNANPLKLREYLATGRPVVAVSNPEIERFSKWVRIARDHAAFVEAIGAALSEPGVEGAQERIAAVSSMTWESRVADVLTTVADGLRNRTRDARVPR